jgi:hypothetical protein
MYDRALKALRNLQQNHAPEPEKLILRNDPKPEQTPISEDKIVQTEVPTAPEEPETPSS